MRTMNIEYILHYIKYLNVQKITLLTRIIDLYKSKQLSRLKKKL